MLLVTWKYLASFMLSKRAPLTIRHTKTWRKFQFEGAGPARNNTFAYISLWQNSNWKITEVQTYRPSFASHFIIQLLLFGLHVLEKRIFAQVFIVSRALEIYIFRHLGCLNLRLAQKFTRFAAEMTRTSPAQPTKWRLTVNLLYKMYLFQRIHLTRIC